MAPHRSFCLLLSHVLAFYLSIAAMLAASSASKTLQSFAASSSDQLSLKSDFGIPRLSAEDSVLASPVEDGIYHVADVFRSDYKEMEKKLKVYVYPDKVIYSKLAGKYASEAYFFRNLMESHFITSNPEEAQLFFLPISCAKLREEGMDFEEITESIQSYVQAVIAKYPYWNRTLGADHFFVTCHEIGTRATSKIAHLVKNAIRVVCTSSYGGSYIPHKDVALPQILQPFPSARGGDDVHKRTTLGFWAGPANSRIRNFLTKKWQNDDELLISNKHVGLQQFYKSKFCICPGGTQVSTARITESIHFGCVPVILSDHYDLPFSDVLDWRTFAVILPEQDVHSLKSRLKSLSSDQYAELHKNMLKAQTHFEWHSPPVQYDTFHMVMYDLWLRHSTIRY